MSHNELCKYLILDRHNIMPEMVIVSASTWNRLDEADRTILKECAANLQANMIAAWGETEQAALDTLAAGGMIITEPDAELLTADVYKRQYIHFIWGENRCIFSVWKGLWK